MIGQVLNALVEFGSVPKRSGAGYQACCPAHDDQTPSLCIDETDNGKVLIHCQAGCPTETVMQSLGLTMAALAGETPQTTDRSEWWTPRGEAIANYDYVSEHGELLFQVLRLPGKGFMQRKPGLDRPWEWRLGDVRRVLYRLPKVLNAVIGGETIWIVEGEEDVHALERVGAVATCNSGGAGKWLDAYADCLKGASECIVVADKDAPGYKHAHAVVASLKDLVEVVHLVEAKTGKDARDHLNAGLGIEDFVLLDEEDAVPRLAPDLHEFLEGDEEYDWVVPGLLERGDRVIITGFEGRGKSHFLRQCAVTIAAGLDPMDFHPIAPQRVLMIDCENGARHTRRQLRPLRDTAKRQGYPVAPGMMRIIMLPSGLDLTREEDSTWLMERVVAHKPDVLIIGPLYRLHAKNPNDEMAARGVVMALDRARNAVGCCVMIEAHASHAEPGQRRAVRPTGSSLWLRWPEFGYGLLPNEDDARDQVIFRSWRGPRDERQWPDELHWGSPWPWVGYWREGRLHHD